MTEREARLVLAAAARPADEALCAEVATRGADAGLALLARRGTALRSPDAIEHDAARAGARVIVPGDPEWPSTLDLAERSPIALWVAGAAQLRLVALRSVAMVGARASTPYGEETARRWAGELASDGWAVVSGGAFGIDAAAHRGALAAGGTTVCVLACGVDVAYPSAHEALLARIADEGLLVSEGPPGTPARRPAFLWRNRLIAALSRATVVVEASLRSGTTSTANHASAFGRPVLAVPGPVSSPMSAGCHALIASGQAAIADDVDAVRAAVEGTIRAGKVPSSARDLLDGTAAAVLEEVRPRTPMAPTALAVASGVTLPATLAALGRLEALGFVRGTPTGWLLAR